MQDMKEAVIYKVLRGMQTNIELLRKKVDFLEGKQEKSLIYKFSVIDDAKAESILRDFLRKMKQEERRHFSIFEISQYLELPADQVEAILEKLEKESIIRYIE